MNRKVFIRIIAVCSILLVAEIVLLLAVFNRKQKKKDSSGGLNSEKPEVTQAPTTVIPTPAQAAERKLKEWEDLDADSPKIQFNPKFQDVWRVTGQKLYSMNEMFTWFSPGDFMEEPLLWTKSVEPEKVGSTQTGQKLVSEVESRYDVNGSLVYYRQHYNIDMYSYPSEYEYEMGYDRLFSPLSEIAFDASSDPAPMFYFDYRYNSDGDVTHKFVTISEDKSYFGADWYPEYKYYYWNDGELAKWEGYSADGKLAEEVEVTYVRDAAGRITEYREDSEIRHIHMEYTYNSSGVLTATRESYRLYREDMIGWRNGYDATRTYNEAGELIAKHTKLFDMDSETRTSTPTDWEEYYFQASEDEKGQRVADFMAYDLDGSASQYGQYHREYVYDDAGNVIERLTYMDGLLLYREEITYEQVKVPRRNLTEEERIRLRIYD